MAALAFYAVRIGKQTMGGGTGNATIPGGALAASSPLGTGILGGLAAYPVAKLLMGLAPAGFTVYMLPFFISTFTGSVLAFVLLRVFEKSQILHTVRR